MMSPIHIFIFLYFIKLTFKHHENQTNYTLLIPPNFLYLFRKYTFKGSFLVSSLQTNLTNLCLYSDISSL